MDTSQLSVHRKLLNLQRIHNRKTVRDLGSGEMSDNRVGAGRMDGSPEAQLQATLNMIPAYTWYAAPSGGITFVNERAADYGGLSSDHPLRYGTDTSAAWDSHIPFLHPEDQEETRRVATDSLRRHQWPGNVRELYNALERAIIVCEDGLIRAQDLCLAPPMVPMMADSTDLRTCVAARRRNQ
jgi:PAS domain-containing protein